MTYKAKWFIFLLIILVLLECTGVGYIGVWREAFWNSVETKNVSVFIWKLAEFTGVALVLCVISGYSQYLINYIALLIRTRLTEIGLSKDYKSIEGGAQRIQEDCFNYPWYGITLATGVLRSVLNLAIFAVLIIVQLGSIYLIIPIVYTLISTLIAGKIAKPLVYLNYMHQCLEAKFRQLLDKKTYDEVVDNNKQVFIATKKLQYFQSFYNQITVLIPIIIAAPIYFASKITFGTLMQVASAMGHVIDSMSYLINSFADVNNWLSCRRRLKELGVI